MNKTLARVIRKIEQDYDIHIFSDKKYVEAIYLLVFGEKLNLKNPKTFNEKLQWLKLYDHNPEYTKMVDKYEAKKYVESIIGKEYTIPTLGVYDRFSDIDFNRLPDKFVLKCTHDSGGIVICRNKELFNREEAKEKLEKALNRNFYYVGREWPYKNVKPRIIAEQYMEDDADGDLKDYKFFCFNGKVKFFKVDFNREQFHRANYYDCNGNILSFGEVICPPDFNKNIVMPSNLNKMIKLAEKVSADKCFVRVDFYSLSDKDIKFGEITFYPASGFGKFIPNEEDKKIGEMLNVSQGGGGVVYSINCEVKYTLQDYKFYCFNGEPKLLYISKGLENHDTARLSFMTLDWKKAPFRRFDFIDFEILPDKPERFDEMLNLAKSLSKGIPFLRVDFYQINYRVYFGELTFYPSSGFIKFYPEKYDGELGKLLKLNLIYN